MNSKASKELIQRWRDRISWIQSSSFEAHENEEVKAKRIAKARTDYAFFVSHYFPHLAAKKTAKFQIEAAEIIKRQKNLRALFEWARGHAKSSHVTLLIPLWLLFQVECEINFMVLVSKSEEAAIRLLSDLQAELQFNEMLLRDFGKQVKEGSWQNGEFVTTNGTMFLALGRSQSPRGLKNRGKRPDYIVIDDIDDDEIVLNPKRVSNALDWILTALFGALEGGRGRFIMVGNRIGKDGILARYATLKNVHHTTVNMIAKNGLPSWPENYTMAEIEAIRTFQGERRFQKEYMNNPVSEGSMFKRKDIRFGKILPLKFYRSLICYTDPSFKNNSTSDYKATILIGKCPEGEYHILKAFIGRVSVAEMVRWHYKIDKWIDGKVPVMYYMESNFLQDLILNEFRECGDELGHQIPIRGDTRKKPDKLARIETLTALFERLLMMINEDEKDSEGVQLLIEQLLSIEKGSNVNDDGPDALEGAVFILNQRTRVSTATYAFGERVNHKF